MFHLCVKNFRIIFQNYLWILWLGFPQASDYGMQWPYDFSTNNSNVQEALLWPATSFSCVYTLLDWALLFLIIMVSLLL
jgi:hypothetical protein